MKINFFLLLMLFNISVSGLELKAKASAVYFENKDLKKIYGKKHPKYELEFTAPINACWQVWQNAGYLQCRGHSIGERDRTHLQLITLDLGLSYHFHFTHCLSFYLGGGMSEGLLKIKDCSPYVQKHTKKNALGGVLKTGFVYSVGRFLFEGFFSYSQHHFHFRKSHSDAYVERHNLNLNQFGIGLALGLNF